MKRKVWWSMFRILLLVVVLLPVVTVFAQKSMVFVPSKAVKFSPADININFEEIQLGENKLNCWWIPVKNKHAKTVIFCHGNAGNLSNRLDTVAFYHKVLNCSLMIFDYSGYGKSGGKVGETQCYKDVRVVYDYVIDELKVKPEDVVIHGRSLGGAVAVDLVKDKPCAGLIMESTFTSVPDMADEMVPIFPIQWFISIGFSSIDKIDKVEVPLLLIHSKGDEIIPYKMGRSLFKKANEPKFWLEISGDHNGGWLESEKVYSKGMQDFFKAL